MSEGELSTLDRVRSIVRAVQVYIPGGSDTKYASQRLLRHVLRRPFERDFRVLSSCVRKEFNLAIDVGGNRGQSIDAIRLILGDIKIVSFEPNPWLARRLQARYPRDVITIHDCGLSDQEGSFILYVPFYRGYMYDGLASLNRGEAAEWLKNRLFGFKDASLEVKEAPVEVAKLDSFGYNVDFIKIDVQGLEASVLRGAIETLERCLPVLLVEAPDAEVQEILTPLGYAPWHYAGQDLVEGIGPGPNTFFLAASR